MMRASVLALLGVVAVANYASAQSVKLPTEVKAQVGRMAAVRIEYDGDDVRWFVSPELDVFREYSADPKDVRLRVLGYTRGQFQVIAISAKGGKLSDFAVCAVTIGDPLPPVPPPAPPGPPVPPNPPTPPPAPVDPVADRLRGALGRDPEDAAAKAKAAQTLGAFYSAMSGHVKDPKVGTVGDLLADYRAAIPSILGPGVVANLRKQIAVEISGVVGDDPTRAIDPALRDALVKLFELIALILSNIK